MALEDLAMFRSVYGSYVFYPSDAVSMERAVELAANTEGICFIRSSRPATPVIYKNDEVFEIGKAKVTFDDVNELSMLSYWTGCEFNGAISNTAIPFRSFRVENKALVKRR